ncbi:MAG TPA: hypothetical protein VMT67_05070 [Terriglobales bacterium]|nr:hypothetical protein [Terriglobales bacterium]
MPSSKQVPRCRHFNTAGVQCGSPAVGATRYCYYHLQGRSTAIHYYSEAPYCAIEEDLPLFEDAHSIQIAIRQVASLLIQKKIEYKTASLLLYSMQLALMNLKMLQAEKPHPARLAVDAQKCEEMMPEPEPEPAPVPEPAPPATPAVSEKPVTKSKYKNRRDDPDEQEIEKNLEYLIFMGRHLNDPAGSIPEEEEYHRLREVVREITGNPDDPPEHEIEGIKQKLAEQLDPKLPPGSIQACAASVEPHVPRRHAV